MARLMNNSLFGLLLMLVLVSHGFCEIFDVSVEEYVKMKEFLASVNKTPVKTIRTKDGDVFDCVDIHKQPSLDHPLLRDHVVQLEPPSYPPMKKLRRPSSYITMMTENEEDEDACPLGTVPMTRVHMEDLLRFGSVENYNSKYGQSGYNPFLLKGGKHQYAIKRTYDGPFYGTRVTMNVWNPTIDQYNRNQVFSLAQLWIMNEQNNEIIDTVEVGWHVYPEYHGGSTATRLFVFYTGNRYDRGSSCYNTRCGFVQVDNKVTPGMILPKVSTYDGTQEDVTISVLKNGTSGDWWFWYGDVPVGYWPKDLFQYMDKEANRVDWGGETDSRPGWGTTYAPMGSGHFPSEGYKKAAYMRNMKVIDTSNNFIDAPSNLLTYAPTPSCYELGDNADDVATIGPHFYYGGPGGTCKTP